MRSLLLEILPFFPRLKVQVNCSLTTMTFPELPIQDLGRFAIGEIPDPIQHQFLSLIGPIPLTGYTASIDIESRPLQTGLGTGTVTIVDSPSGIVQYTWHEDDMAEIGYYRLQMHVSKVGSRLSSDIFTYEVYDGPTKS